jgi:hypothetical protein
VDPENNNDDLDRRSATGQGSDGAGDSPQPSEAAVEARTQESPVEEGKDKGAPPSPTPSPHTPSGVWPKSAVDRVAKLTARLRDYEARAAGGQQTIDPATGQAFTPAQIDQMINERATLVANQTAFNTRCNDAANRGAAKYPDWQVRLSGLTQLVDQTDARSLQNYNLFLEAALETGEAEAIIHRLGADLNLASRILGLSPMKMAMEVGKLADGKGGEPSKAPKPIRPVGSTSPVTTTKPDDPERGAEMKIDDWMNARNKQAAERRIR